MEQRTILITGAGSGLGRGLARQLAAGGHRIIATDLNESAVKETIAGLNDAIAEPLDVTSADQMTALIVRHGDIDVLINNAGLQHVSPIEDFDAGKFSLLIDVMLKGPFLLSKAVIPGMRSRNFGRIVNIGSIHSLVASPFKSAYIAAKHGLLGLAKTIALETGNADITINTICPAYLRTPLVDAQIKAQAAANKISEEQVIDQIMLAPMPKKAFITVDEVTAAVTFLIDPLARNITGQTIVIDGGWTAR